MAHQSPATGQQSDAGDAHGGHVHGVGSHGAAANRRRLAIVLALAATFMVAEVIGGIVTNSLALLADAGHMLSDVAALALSIFALWIAQRPPTPQRSYGYYRTEILAALANGATLVGISIYIFVEAYARLRSPPEVQGGLMMAIAAGGLVVNVLGLWILNAGKANSLNMRGAWLHVLTDALGSVGALMGGAAIWVFGWAWADPVVSMLIGLLVIYSSWNLLKETVNVLMEGAPGHVDVDAVRNEIAGTSGVVAVHDLHVWSITSGMVAVSGHVQVAESVTAAEYGPTLAGLRTRLQERFGIHHITIQLEPVNHVEPEMHQ